MFTTSIDKLRKWSEGNSLWVHHLATSCCSLEVLAASGPRYDWERFGFFLQENPSEADLLIISGPLTKAMATEARAVYDKMRAPKFVVSIGSCANSGGMFADKSGTVLDGIDKILPVDLYVPGCPPRPEAVIHALLKLQEKILSSSPNREAVL